MPHLAQPGGMQARGPHTSSDATTQSRECLSCTGLPVVEYPMCLMCALHVSGWSDMPGWADTQHIDATRHALTTDTFCSTQLMLPTAVVMLSLST